MVGGGTQGASMLGSRHSGVVIVPGCCTQTCELTSKLGSQHRLSPEVQVEVEVEVPEHALQVQSHVVPVASTSPRISNPMTIFFMMIINLPEDLPINIMETLNFRIRLFSINRTNTNFKLFVSFEELDYLPPSPPTPHLSSLPDRPYRTF